MAIERVLSFVDRVFVLVSGEILLPVVYFSITAVGTLLSFSTL